MDQIRQYWMQLKPRERVLLIGAGAVLLLLVLYLSVWEPLLGNADRLEHSVQENRELVNWMEQAAAEVKRLRASQPGGGGLRRGQSLLGVIDRTAKSGELGSAVKRIEPDGQDRVRVWLEGAAFDDLVVWLGEIQSQYGLKIDSAVIDRGVSEGRVSARLVVVGGAG